MGNPKVCWLLDCYYGECFFSTLIQLAGIDKQIQAYQACKIERQGFENIYQGELAIGLDQVW